MQRLRHRGKLAGKLAAGIASAALACALAPGLALADAGAATPGAASITAGVMAQAGEEAADLSAALKGGSSLQLTSTDASQWTVVAGEGDRTYIQSAAKGANVSVAIDAEKEGWLIFDWGFAGSGNWSERFSISSEGATSVGNYEYIQPNSSNYQGKWVTRVLPIKAGKTTITWTTVNSNSSADSLTSAAWLDEIRFVDAQTSVSVTADDGAVASATVGKDAVTQVDPGTTVTFAAEGKDGNLFAGWKTSLDATEYVNEAASFTQLILDEPATYFAISEKVFEGKGTEADPFVISTVADLNTLAKFVGNGTSFAGAYFKLANDIDAGAAEFAGIGSNLNAFAGAFDGNGKAIANIKLAGRGLFNCAASGATIKDLTVDATLVASADQAGIVAGLFTGTMTNVVAKGSVDSAYQKVGGIVGSLGGESTIDACSSEAKITLTYKGNTQPIAGGIAGECSYSTAIKNSSFTGSIDGGEVASVIGGIAGQTSSTTISGCTVVANLAGKQHIGGIVGYTNGSALALSDCEYTGNVSGATNVGGIVGYLYGPWSAGSSTPKVNSSKASGTVTATDGRAGGIAGYADRSSETKDCLALQNSVSGTDAAARIAPKSTSDAIIMSGNAAWADTLVNGTAIASDDITAVADGVNGRSLVTVEVPNLELPYTGAERTFAIEGATLQGVTSATMPGVYDVQATLEDGRIWADMTLDPKALSWQITADIAKAAVSGIPSQAYTGSAIEPDFTVTLDGFELVKGSDYEVEYAGNQAPGSAIITIKGMGSYSGMVTTRFEIAENEEYAADAEAADGVADAIEALPAIEELTAESGDAIEQVNAAVAAFNELSDAQKALVDPGDIAQLLAAVAKANEVAAEQTKAEQAKAEQQIKELQSSLENAQQAAQRTDLSAAKVTVAKATYTGKALEPVVKVTLDGKTLVAGTDYELSFVNNKKAGSAVAMVVGAGVYAGATAQTFAIAKAAQPMTVKAKGATVKAGKSVNAKKVFTVKKKQGAVTYKKVSGSKKIAVASNGKITVKKGLKKGTYKIKVKVTAKGNDNYKSGSKNVSVSIKVK